MQLTSNNRLPVFKDKVQNSKYQRLTFFRECLKMLMMLEGKFTQDQQVAIHELTQDKSIFSKCINYHQQRSNAVDTASYEKTYLDHLLTQDFYQKTLYEQNKCDRKKIDQVVE